jgi:hypothetical protein
MTVSWRYHSGIMAGWEEVYVRLLRDSAARKQWKPSRYGLQHSDTLWLTVAWVISCASWQRRPM